MPTSNNFMENYKICCSDSKTRLKVKSDSQDKCLQFNADRLDVEDWTPLTNAIRIDRSLHALVIKSEYPGKKCRRSLLDNVKPSIHKPNVMQELMDSITVCMKESNILSTIQLQSLSINQTHIDILSNGIKSCQSLQHLAITRCQLNDTGTKLICDSIIDHTGIQTVNLTNCNITKEGARHIADLIRGQRLARYGETWKQSLRYREPNPELFPGIRRITLNDNTEISDEGFSLIQHEILDDLWIKAVDMQNCGLSNLSGNLSIELLKTNTTLCVLDIRRNDNIVQDTIKTIKTVLINRNNNNNAEKRSDNEIENNYNCIYDWLEGSATMTNRSDICSSRKPNSEYSFKTAIKNNNNNYNNNNNIKRLNLIKTNSLTNELRQKTKRFTNETASATRDNSLIDVNVKLELEKQQKEKEILAEKLVKEWNRRKLIEEERDKLKEKLQNYINEINNNNNNSNGVSNYCLTQSKSLNFKKIKNTHRSLSAITTSGSTTSKKSTKRINNNNNNGNNKKLSRNKLKCKKSQKKNTCEENNHTKVIISKNNERMRISNNNTAISKSDSEIKKNKDKYQTKHNNNQNEIQNIQENLDKIKIKNLQLDNNTQTALKEDENEQHDKNNDDNNAKQDNLEIIAKKDFRDLSPTSRSQWILKELMNGNKNRNKNNFTPNLNRNKYDESIETVNGKIDKLPKIDFGSIDVSKKWDLTVSF